MSNWINDHTKLTGETVELLPLDIKHFETLCTLAKDVRIWEFLSVDGSNPLKLKEALTNAILEKEKGNQYPFVIFHKQDQKIIGSTRFLDIQPQHAKLEIGWTWLHPHYWATDVNLECKLLLLTHCFERLQATRVQLKTHEKNIRSRKAIEKIGGQFEGILRNDMILDNGTKRNSAYYSIIDDEWDENKFRLGTLYQIKKEGMINA